MVGRCLDVYDGKIVGRRWTPIGNRGRIQTDSGFPLAIGTASHGGHGTEQQVRLLFIILLERIYPFASVPSNIGFPASSKGAVIVFAVIVPDHAPLLQVR